MDASNSLISSQFLSPLQLKHVPSTSSGQQLPASILIQEQRNDRPLLYVNRTPQEAMEGKQMETRFPNEEFDTVDSDNNVQEFQRQLMHWQGLWSLSLSLQMGRIASLSPSWEPLASKKKKLAGMEPSNVIALAKTALSASKHAASLAERQKSFESNLDKSLTSRLGSSSLYDVPVEQQRIVRSTRLMERQSKKRRVPKPEVIVQETNSSRRTEIQRSKSKALDPDDPLRLFLWLPETKQLLTAKEESELIVQVQELMMLEEVKGRLHALFGREPTLCEWAEAAGLTCRALKTQIRCSNDSREKLIYANFRLVVHIAKQYQGRGLNLQDLLQEGSMGLMRSVQKFKPQAGCRFATYAYWWIRQAVRRAIFQHSRTIRLPENVYDLLNKVTEAKRQCIQEGHHHPTNEQIAARARITLDKLQILQYSVRTPLSMQQPVWSDQSTTFQQITADTAIETPKMSAEKQLMRQHVRNLLGILSPRDRKIMRMRYGLDNGKSKSLSEIGTFFGLSKERVRQLESRAMYKLKRHLVSEGLDAYEELLI